MARYQRQRDGINPAACCLYKKGDLKAAREQLNQAEALFQDMGLDWWTRQAEGLRGRIQRGEPLKWFAPYVDGPPAV